MFICILLINSISGTYSYRLFLVMLNINTCVYSIERKKIVSWYILQLRHKGNCHISMPRLQVHCERTLAFPATLVNVPRSLVEISKHGHEAITMAVGASDVRTACADIGDGHADSSSTL